MPNKAKLITLSAMALSLCMVLSLTACGSSSNSYNSATSSAAIPAPAAAPTAPRMGMNRMADKGGIALEEKSDTAVNPSTANPDTAASPDVGGSGQATAVSQRKLVKNGELSLETKEFDAAIPALIQMVETAGGYIENQSVEGKSMRSDGEYYERHATITARVPAGKLTGITAEMGTLCNIASQSESVSDITDRYYDASAHLEMLRVQEKRLLELLSKAETLEIIIQLENALTNCQYEIESLTGQLRRMDSQVEYSTLSIYVNEVVDYSIPLEKPKNFVERLGEAFVRSGKNLSRAMESMLFFLIIDGPVLAIYLFIMGIIFFIFYRAGQNYRKRQLAKQLAKGQPPVSENRPENE
ncbi:MAG: DUF4349 domain-containing protein [Angelakisella sp.]